MLAFSAFVTGCIFGLVIGLKAGIWIVERMIQNGELSDTDIKLIRSRGKRGARAA